MPKLRRLLASALVALVASSAPARGQTAERILSYDVDIAVRASGQLHVREAIDYDFGANDKHGIFRTIPDRTRYDAKYDRAYPLYNIHVSASRGTPAKKKVSREGSTTIIRIGDENRTITGRHRYQIDYDVDGALTRFADHDELYWNAIGTEWSVPIDAATATVHTDASVTRIACYAGESGSRLACTSSRTAGQTATFTQQRLPAYGGLTVVVALPVGAVARPGPILRERWTVNRAFARTPLSVGLSVFLLVIGVGYGARLVWRTGRDRRFRGEVPGLLPPRGSPVVEETRPLFTDAAGPIEFAPPDMRPAMMGVLLDESADALDVTATIVDLAVRRHLRIDEKPRKWFL
ncbi:MAG: DUF2207 domain-containing protein, partial [Mycobacteriales bacterium]